MVRSLECRVDLRKVNSIATKFLLNFYILLHSSVHIRGVPRGKQVKQLQSNNNNLLLILPIQNTVMVTEKNYSKRVIQHNLLYVFLISQSLRRVLLSSAFPIEQKKYQVFTTTLK